MDRCYGSELGDGKSREKVEGSSGITPVYSGVLCHV